MKIENIVEEKLNELKLNPVLKLSDFVKDKKRFYAGPFLINKKEKVFFKILLIDDVSPNQSIRREIKIREFLAGFKNNILFPHLLKYNNTVFPYWFISQYIEGSILGYFYEIYDEKEKYIPLIIDVLFELHNIPSSKLKNIFGNKEFYFWENDFNQYFNMIKSYEGGIEEKTAQEINFSEIYRILREEKHFFQETYFVLAHGDFTLANLVISNEKLYLTDWEHSHLDNFAYDIAHLWIQLWRYPKWQKRLVSEFINRLPRNRVEEFKSLFRIVVISEALGEIKWSIKLCPKKYKKNAKKAALKTIEAAIKGFNNLLKL